MYVCMDERRGTAGMTQMKRERERERERERGMYGFVLLASTSYFF
jgi:hypothetical protein